MAKAIDHYRALLKLWQGLQSDLAALESHPDVQKYGAAAGAEIRRALLEDWAKEARAAVGQAKADIAAALKGVDEHRVRMVAAIRAGKDPSATHQAPPKPWSDQEEDYLTIGERARLRQSAATERAMLESLSAIRRELERNTATAQASQLPSATLGERLRAYTDSAKIGQTFDYQGFARDRAAIMPILQARAAAGDMEARAVLDTQIVGTIESALLARHGADEVSDGDLSNLTAWNDALLGKPPEASLNLLRDDMASLEHIVKRVDARAESGAKVTPPVQA
jgi:hypothetical protein